jgi:glycosyltransferase involved in cell wall biosynthesis
VKIIQLATSLKGGAGSAALRLNNALNIAGEDSMIISRDSALAPNNSNVIASSINPLKKLESSGVTFLQSKILQRNNDLVTPGSISTYNNKFDKELETADIIHIHAYYNLLSSSSLRKILMLGKPTFFTLHDQRFFTGGCHYSRDCNNFQVDCSKCPQVKKPFTSLVKKSFLTQRSVFEFSKNVELVSPSHWLANSAKMGAISKNLPVHVVKNPIPKIFFDTKASSERNFGNPLRVAFIATNLHNPYKNLKLFTNALNDLSKVSQRKINVVLVGSGTIPNFHTKIDVENAQPNNDSEMAYLLSTIDLVIVPSSQDNSPSVIGEALAVGVPVIGSDVGGIPEILSNFQMPIFSLRDGGKLTELMADWNSQIDHEAIRSKAKKEFSEEIIGKELVDIYLKLYRKLF